MRQDRIKWNAKYQRGSEISEPSLIVREFFSLASGKRVLDIAAGNGRNAIYLAEHGFDVDAVDISETGLALFAGSTPTSIRFVPILTVLTSPQKTTI